MKLRELIDELEVLRHRGYGELEVVTDNDDVITGVEYNTDGGDPAIVLYF